MGSLIGALGWYGTAFQTEVLIVAVSDEHWNAAHRYQVVVPPTGGYLCQVSQAEHSYVSFENAIKGGVKHHEASVT